VLDKLDGIFEAAGIIPGTYIQVVYAAKGYYPPRFSGVVEKIYPLFAVVRVVPGGYRACIHLRDITTGVIKVGVTGGRGS
jgi:hypothetical protein